ncbi:hypothetical protein L2E82_27607 [Cichorium intybus]|uniref:Uncharacterized protein n=1 Tax=Cichorium intybus TaxID=13427 RepID=A0ACB9CTH5_CICIN|nr:hypothetical protein L2E82_27607 [Cichorium intybus]
MMAVWQTSLEFSPELRVWSHGWTSRRDFLYNIHSAYLPRRKKLHGLRLQSVSEIAEILCFDLINILC